MIKELTQLVRLCTPNYGFLQSASVDLSRWSMPQNDRGWRLLCWLRGEWNVDAANPGGRPRITWNAPGIADQMLTAAVTATLAGQINQYVFQLGITGRAPGDINAIQETLPWLLLPPATSLTFEYTGFVANDLVGSPYAAWIDIHEDAFTRWTPPR